MLVRRLLIILLAASIPMACLASEPIYDEHADAAQLIQTAIAEASLTHKNIVLDFGANWCGDCHALDMQMHKASLASLIEKNYVVVHIDVGRFNKNLDVARKYHVPIRHGIPALAVLDPRGNLLYTQDQGQFADASSLAETSFREFFEKWVPGRVGARPAVSKLTEGGKQ